MYYNAEAAMRDVSTRGVPFFPGRFESSKRFQAVILGAALLVGGCRSQRFLETSTPFMFRLGLIGSWFLHWIDSVSRACSVIKKIGEECP